MMSPAFDQAENGDIVALYNPQKVFLSWAFYSRHSRITFRCITIDPQTIDQTYWRLALQRAVDRRTEFLDRNKACRLVFSEADGIPGLITDWYAGHLVVQALIPGIDRILDKLVVMFQEILHPDSILIRNDLEARSIEHLPLEVRTSCGKVPERVRVEEGFIQYEVDLVSGQKTGAYLDQRENRLHLVSYPQSQGRVLDCFCYTGGFGLHLALKAKEVLAVDDSAQALAWGQKNAELNGLSNISFQKKNIFDYLKEADEQGLQFDLIVLDLHPLPGKRQRYPLPFGDIRNSTAGLYDVLAREEF